MLMLMLMLKLMLMPPLLIMRRLTMMEDSMYNASLYKSSLNNHAAMMPWIFRG